MAYTETQVWGWLLFGGILPTSRAKALLESWLARGQSVREALAALPGAGAALGLSATEAQALRLPSELPEVAALRWNEPIYPQSLLRMPVKQRPALLFHHGALHLLQRPIIYLPPAALSADEHDLLCEASAFLLGEAWLPAAAWGSAQAALLLEELQDSEGELLLLARCGLEHVVLTEKEQQLMVEGRLLILSALAPAAPPNPRWDEALAQVEMHLAQRCIFTGATPAPVVDLPSLWLSAAPAAPADPLPRTADPTALLMWLADIGAPAAQPAPAGLSDELSAPPPLPPLPPEEALRILAKGGNIPAVLRDRLLRP